MHRILYGVVCAAVVFGLSGRAALAAPANPLPADVERVGVWQAPDGKTQLPIWPHAAPDPEETTRKPERVRTSVTPDALGGDVSQGVFDVSVPTMTVYPPKGHNTGAAVVVFPGGGFVMLAITLEGTEICDWITSRGMTCILSKYRVPGGNHHYDKDCNCAVTPRTPFALQDAQRTIRLVRAHAAQWRIDPAKVGVIGFSAGGYLVAQASNIFTSSYAPVDAADRLSSRPDFAIAAYPGHLCRDGKFAPGFKVTARTTPTFLLQDWDDPVDDICNSTLYARALEQAGVPAEVHLFAKGGHAFGLRPSQHPVVKMWPVLLEQWLKEIGIL
ncbi:alpha/beta hydrolase [Pseudoxanthomonas sp. X-1]|uniref:alpha/beta hydrolase n=1 Tax=Pseudoxanthomonas sp. X-1 TaxID=2571115 RepID=UPI00110B0C7A|nr:alpha/beta hydrolase [Pseudoxanthomonas sp. X-1]TMN24326.1 alpha/beta hydrolase [Pseudoxanthomonas sp. X-1]UAY73443.1 alpha/beta hydrolase [Pseudoxanthomonas sp. X-1]